LAALDDSGIPVRSLVVNRVTPDGPACRMCDPRRAGEQRVLARVARLAARRNRANPVNPANPANPVNPANPANPVNLALNTIPADLREPRGVGALARL